MFLFQKSSHKISVTVVHSRAIGCISPPPPFLGFFPHWLSAGEIYIFNK